MNLLSRFWARVSIVLVVCFVVVAGYSAYSENMPLYFVGITIMFVAFAIQNTKLRCPICGYRRVVPQWSKNKTMKCKKCAQPLEYDQ